MSIAALVVIAREKKKTDNPHVLQGVELWNIYTMEYYSAVKRSKLLVRQKTGSQMCYA